LVIHKADILKHLRTKYPNQTEQEIQDFYKDISWGYAGKYYAIISILKDRGIDIDSAFKLAGTIKIQDDDEYYN